VNLKSVNRNGPRFTALFAGITGSRPQSAHPSRKSGPGSRPALRGRAYVAIDPEQVVGVVFGFDVLEPLEVIPITGLQSILVVVGELEVHVVAAGRVAADTLPGIPDPFDMRFRRCVGRPRTREAANELGVSVVGGPVVRAAFV